jgi:GT2 family glycosyltransferase
MSQLATPPAGLTRWAVVIVNWQGGQDTAECIASILGATPRARLVLVDNGSRDDSLARIDAALAAFEVQPLHWAGGSLQALAHALADPACKHAQAIVVSTGENLGFAAGSNLGLAVCQAMDAEHTVFLNNDTLVHGRALEQIVARLAQDSALFATLPMLTIHGCDRIWNCGGEIHRIGLRRYHHAERVLGSVALPAEIPCSFFTGCCFAVRTAAFVARGGFYERFFFGEEDFELALWMRDRRLQAVCLTTAVVAHKVSASFSAAAGPRQDAKVFVYYLNRFIHMRLRLGTVRWRLWLLLVLPYTTALLWRRPGVQLANVLSMLARLLRLSSKMDRVTRADFEAVMAGKL